MTIDSLPLGCIVVAIVPNSMIYAAAAQSCSTLRKVVSATSSLCRPRQRWQTHLCLEHDKQTEIQKCSRTVQYQCEGIKIPHVATRLDTCSCRASKPLTWSDNLLCRYFYLFFISHMRSTWKARWVHFMLCLGGIFFVFRFSFFVFRDQTVVFVPFQASTVAPPSPLCLTMWVRLCVAHSSQPT